MDTARTKDRIQSLLGYVEISRMAKRRMVFWSYFLMILGLAAAVMLAVWGVAIVEAIAGFLAFAVACGFVGYGNGRDMKRWKRLSGELRGWLGDTERLLQAGPPESGKKA